MLSKWFATLMVGLSLAACAADNDPDNGRGGSSAGTSGGANAGSGSTAGISGGGNNTSGVNGGAAGAAGGAGAADGGIVEPVFVDHCGAGNLAGFTDADFATVKAGGAPGELGYLYPYDNTVFPRGLIAPLFMWKGADDADAVYIHIKSSLFELHGCYKPTGPGQLQIGQDVWTLAEGATLGSADPFTVELSVMTGGVARGPIAHKVIIAQATLKGSIFYNSYASKLSSGQGAVLRVVPGKLVDLFIGGSNPNSPGCNGCHSVSANGTRLVTLAITAGSANAYALDPTTMPGPPLLNGNAAGASFVGLHPTGSVYASNAELGGLRMRVGSTGTTNLYETDTGTLVAGTGIPGTALMPTFSSDGSLLVFNDASIAEGKALALMDYDTMGRKATNHRKIYEGTDDKLAGWPFVLPDNKGVVFHKGTQSDFSGGNVGIALDGFGLPIPGPTTGPYGNLFIVDVGSGTTTLLAKAMGFSDTSAETAANSYLPFATDEVNMNYYPTVSPVAAGGYFWVFFDSERHYGNLGLYRQLWGTAITISPSGTYTSDPSHPAFFLTGQEFATGNHRAFTALDPCKMEGDTCKTGIDCCGGFCEFPEGQELTQDAVGMCKKPEQPRCAKTDEACESATDCCDKNNSCIAGFCGIVIPE
jgi:hypothetical protein